MANINTRRKRAAGKAGYGVKRGHPINSRKARETSGKKPWIGGTPPKKIKKGGSQNG